MRPASYKGVPFGVDEYAKLGGKRVQIHEYAGRNDHFVEELGAKAWVFPVTAHLIGDDVFEQRDRLIEALRSEGPGTLVLPADGEIEATCLDIRVRNRITGEGRISRLGLTFVESGKNQFPAATVDTGRVVLDQSDAGIVALSSRFSALFSLPDLVPTFVVDAAVSLSTLVIDGVDAAVSRADAITGLKDDLLRTNAALASDLRNVVGAPRTLASSLTGLYRSFSDLDAPWEITLAELDALEILLNPTPTVATGTANRLIEAQNQAALQRLNERTAVVEKARVATRATLVSANDAAALRDKLDVDLDAALVAAGDAGEDDVFTELRELRAAVVQDLDSRGARLPSIRTFTVPATMPALVVADRLYDDPTRDAEIVARNGLRSPGFIPALTQLEVLAE